MTIETSTSESHDDREFRVRCASANATSDPASLDTFWQNALLDVTCDVVVARDFADHILYWNEGARRMYGWTAAEAVGRTMSELVLSREPDVAAGALRAVQEKGNWSGEMRHRTRAGVVLTVHSRWTLVRDRDGEPRGILIVSTDLTETKRLTAQLLRAQRLESIGTLASGLAHDLNNVLAPIMMSVHMLKEEHLSETARMCLDTLETCSQRGADIVSQVLTFARGVEGSRIPLHPKQFLTETVRIIRETFPRSIRVQNHLCKQPWLIEGDVTQMQQVLMNLCVNARDAMPNGGVLTLAMENVHLNGEAPMLHPRAHSGNYVMISVADTGTGIAPEIKDKIFDPFFTTKPLGHGTGLGLPTVLGIAEAHGGFVVFESEVGKGTTFRVYLPAAETDEGSDARFTGAVRLPRGNGELVLVVDDEPAVCRIIETILTGSGYRVVTASEGREAVDVFARRANEFQLVIVDLMMPDWDGAATLRELRALRPDVRAVTITGLGEDSKPAEARTAGGGVFIRKPFTAEQLLFAVGHLMESPAN